MRRPTWQELLDKFNSFTVEELSLKVIIGGDKKLVDFKGFETIGEKSKDAVTGLYIYGLLHRLPLQKLSEELPEEEFNGDKLGIGTNKVRLAYTSFLPPLSDNDNYWIMQDYLGKNWVDPSDEEVEDTFKRETYYLSYMPDADSILVRELIKPNSRLVIENIDGACLLDESDYLKL